MNERSTVHLLRALPPLLLDDEPVERAALRVGASQVQGAGAAVQGGGGTQGNDTGGGTSLGFVTSFDFCLQLPPNGYEMDFFEGLNNNSSDLVNQQC